MKDDTNAAKIENTTWYKGEIGEHMMVQNLIIQKQQALIFQRIIDEKQTFAKFISKSQKILELKVKKDLQNASFVEKDLNYFHILKPMRRFMKIFYRIFPSIVTIINIRLLKIHSLR